MAGKNYENIIRTLFDEVFTKGNIAKCDELLTPNVKCNDPGLEGNFKGLKGFKEAETLYTRAFPGKRAMIETIFTAENKVVVFWRCKGMHKGELHGIPPSNKPFDITGISVYQFENGKISEIWQNWDRLSLYEQIGEVAPKHALHG